MLPIVQRALHPRLKMVISIARHQETMALSARVE